MSNRRFGESVVSIRRDLREIDPARMERLLRHPELGPKLLFISGGTALNEFSKKLKKYTHNSTHLVTPFDSGGSSAVLRKAFEMPAVGDLRSRMMALADDSVLGHPSIYTLFTHRLSANKSNDDLKADFIKILSGKSRLTRAVSEPMRSLICDYLEHFNEQAPNDFDYRGASIGNLILTGGYLSHKRSLDPIAFLFSQLVGVRGIVRTITDENTHIAAITESGRRIIRQHKITGKSYPALGERIVSVSLCDAAGEPVESKLKKQGRRLIRSSELIVLPPGSFYTSLLANLLPKGVGRALVRNPAPKVYVPNLGTDPEQFGMSLQDQIETLEQAIRHDANLDETHSVIDILMIDSNRLSSVDSRLASWCRARGIEVIDTDLGYEGDASVYDPEKLCQNLLMLT